MTTLNTEDQTTLAASGTAQEPKATTKANVAPRRPHVTPSKGKSGKKTTPAKRGAKGAKRAKVPEKAAGARQGSKTEKVLDLLKRPDGASLKDIMKATDWQPHSVRGFLSGTIGKKMGLKVESTTMGNLILRGGFLCLSLVLFGASAKADPLFVIASSIANGQVFPGPDVSLVLTFNVPFDPSSFVGGDLSLLDPLSNAVAPNFFTIDATDTILTIDWSGLSLAGTYKYTIANIHDLDAGDKTVPFSGNFVIASAPVPEPSSLLLLGAGLLGVLAIGQKKLFR